MKLLINTFFALYFFIGMDIIYWQVHTNDNTTVNYYFKVDGGTGNAYECYDTPQHKICSYNGYSLVVDTYWEV